MSEVATTEQNTNEQPSAEQKTVTPEQVAQTILKEAIDHIYPVIKKHIHLYHRHMPSSDHLHRLYHDMVARVEGGPGYEEEIAAYAILAGHIARAVKKSGQGSEVVATVTEAKIDDNWEQIELDKIEEGMKIRIREASGEGKVASTEEGVTEFTALKSEHQADRGVWRVELTEGVVLESPYGEDQQDDEADAKPAS